jgi:hypothetical protein
MAGSKTKKAKRRTRAKAASTRAASKKSRQKSPKPTRKPVPAKRVVAKKVPAKKGSAKTAARGARAGKLAATKGLVKTRPPAPVPPQAPAPPATPAPPPKTFAEKVRDCDAGTLVWFRVGDLVTHGEIQGPGAAGTVNVLSKGVVGPVPAGDLFETLAAVPVR